MSHSGDLFLSLPLELTFYPTHGSYRFDELHSHDGLGYPLFESGINHRDKEITRRLTKLLSKSFTIAMKEENPWTLREEFYGDGRSEGFSGFEGFTYFYGRFGVGPSDLVWPQPGRFNERLLRLRLQEDFEEWQELLRTAMKIPIEKWPSLTKKFSARKVAVLQKPLPLKLEWRKERPVGVLKFHTAVDAIIASIQIDKLNGVEFRYCARSDCRKPYRIESRHKRIYCSTDCAHYMAVRASRKRAEKKEKHRT